MSVLEASENVDKNLNSCALLFSIKGLSITELPLVILIVLSLGTASTSGVSL